MSGQHRRPNYSNEDIMGDLQMENINFEDDDQPLEMGEMSLQEEEISRVQPNLEEDEFSPSEQEQREEEEQDEEISKELVSLNLIEGHETKGE